MTPSEPAVHSWVVGAGGLLGRALTRELTSAGDVMTRTQPIAWQQPDLAHEQLAATTRAMLTASGRRGGRWRISWCAGTGVTGSSQANFLQEVRSLQIVLDTITSQLQAGVADPAAGAVFVASSAGGVYAGATDPPFTEQHQPQPNSNYGRAKLDGEQRAKSFADDSGVATVIGRITNLYGPGQNLAKPQGLISHLCRAQLAHTSTPIYVSLDTIRDYLYVNDCAAMVRLALDGVAEVSDERQRWVLKIFGAHQGVTVGSLLGELHRMFKRAPLVVLGSSPNARYQARDLRVRSTIWHELDARAMTSLPVGLAATTEDLFRSVRIG